MFRHLVLLIALSAFAPAAPAAAPPPCSDPITAAGAPEHFRGLARRQLELEFGKRPIRFHDLRAAPVGRDMLRVTGYAELRRPGAPGPEPVFLTGWVSRCSGTVLIRNHTWLADGTLDAPRWTADELPGAGTVLGPEDAPVQVIAFVDSRCPQCHLLIEYGRELAAAGRMRLELRQVAMLEPPPQAVRDTRLPESPLVAGPRARIDQAEYVELLSGLPADTTVPEASPAFRLALALVERNTATATDVLHLNTTPGVLVLDDPEQGRYRLTGHWEMNRLFQPDL